MTKDAILGVIRHLLTFGGGYVAAQAYASSDEITTGVSAVMTLIGIVWSVVEKRQSVEADDDNAAGA